MLFEVQDRRLRAYAIRESYEALVAKRGLWVCVWMREEADGREWHRPLVCYYPVFNLTQCDEIEKIGEALPLRSNLLPPHTAITAVFAFDKN